MNDLMTAIIILDIVSLAMSVVALVVAFTANKQ